MPSTRSALLTLGLVGGCIVAFVQAQELAGRGQPSNGPTVAESTPGIFAEDAATRPLTQPGRTGAGGDASVLAPRGAAPASARSATTSNRRRGSLSERLRAARRPSEATPPARSSYAPARQSINDPSPVAAENAAAGSPAPADAPPEQQEPGDVTAPPLLPPAQSTEDDQSANDDSPREGEDTGSEPAFRTSNAAAGGRAEGLPSVLKRPPTSAWRSASGQTTGGDESPLTPREVSSESHEIGSGRAAAPVSQAAQTPRAVAAASESPSLRVQTIGPAAVTLGKQATWQVVVENAGATAAEEVAVTISLPSSLEIIAAQASAGAAEQSLPSDDNAVLAWTMPRLAASAQARLSISAIPKSGGSLELRTDWTCRPPALSTQIEVQEPKLEVEISGPAEVLYGRTEVYTIVFSNPGTGDAENVQVSLSTTGDQEAASQVGTIAAGGKKQMQVELVARQAGLTEIQLQATADGGLQAEAARQIKVRRAELQVAVQGPKLHFAGTPATYRISIANAGDALAREVQVVASLPAGARPAADSDESTAEENEGSLAWNIGDLAPGAEQEIEFRCEFTAAGESAIVAQAQAEGDLSASAEAVTQVEAIAELKLVVNDPPGAQPVGQDVVYEVVITNRGSRAAKQVEVLAQFSDGIEPTAAAGAAAELVTGQAIFKPLSQIAPGQSLTLKVTARADQPGSHIFRAEVRCADPETKLVSESTTRYFGDAR